MSVVRPEFGPTLPEIVGPRFKRLPKAGRIAVIVALVLAAIAAVALRQSTVDPPLASVLVREPIAFTLGYDDNELRRVDPQGGEGVRLVQPKGRPYLLYTATSFTLPAYRGDVSAKLLGQVSQKIIEMRKADPNFVYRGEGRVRVNEQPGHYVAYQTKVDGKTAYGRRYLFVPGTEPGDPQPRDAADITLVAGRVPKIIDTYNRLENSPLKRPFRSFRFGTERP